MTRPSDSPRRSLPAGPARADCVYPVGLLLANEADAGDCVGPSANTATAASVCAVSEMSRIRPGRRATHRCPRPSSRRPRQRPFAPIWASTFTKARSPCRLLRRVLARAQATRDHGRREEVRRGRRVGLDRVRRTLDSPTGARTTTARLARRPRRRTTRITARVMSAYGRDTSAPRPTA